MPRRLSDRSRSLDQLEGVEEGPTSDDSYLVQMCHALRRKPIGEFTVEDLRIMIGQRTGLAHLVPLALDILERDPLAAGDYYPGDLLKSVLDVPAEFWRREWEWRDRLCAIVPRVAPVPPQLAAELAAFEATCGPTIG
jgi:hypothetical protein